LKYCEQRNSKEVVERFEAYKKRAASSINMKILNKLIETGRINDPHKQSLEVICPKE